MNSADGKNAVVAKHLENLANAAKNYTLAALASVSGGGSGGATSGNVLSTVASTVDGSLWYELVNNAPVLKLRHGNYAYNFNYDTLTYHGGNSNLVAYLPCDSSLSDACGNTWAVTGNPTISTSPSGTGNALYLTTSSYLTLSDFPLGGQDFTIDGWFYVIDGGNAFRTIEVFKTGQDYVANIAKRSNTNYWYSETKSMAITFNEWAHLALVYHNDTGEFKTYVNGQLLDTNSSTLLQTRQTSGCGVYIGESAFHNSDGRINAYVKKLRIFDGVALWTSDFTPPTANDYA